MGSCPLKLLRTPRTVPAEAARRVIASSCAEHRRQTRVLMCTILFPLLKKRPRSNYPHLSSLARRSPPFPSCTPPPRGWLSVEDPCANALCRKFGDITHALGHLQDFGVNINISIHRSIFRSIFDRSIYRSTDRSIYISTQIAKHVAHPDAHGIGKMLAPCTKHVELTSGRLRSPSWP